MGQYNSRCKPAGAVAEVGAKRRGSKCWGEGDVGPRLAADKGRVDAFGSCWVPPDGFDDALEKGPVGVREGVRRTVFSRVECLVGGVNHDCTLSEFSLQGLLVGWGVEEEEAVEKA